MTESSKLLSGRLEVGLNEPLRIREERISSQPNACRVAYVSDIHQRRGRTDHLIRQVSHAVRQSAADVILPGGDMLNGRSELGKLTELIDCLRDFAPVMAVGGNHDYAVGIAQVSDAIKANEGQWIHDSTATFTHGDRTITISGPDAIGCVESRVDDVRILCAHNPRIWKNSRRQGYDLVLAGHLHGCQFVAFEFGDRLYPGALFYPYCYLSHQCGTTKLVVSRGVSDLVPIRWRCPREVVLCYV